MIVLKKIGLFVFMLVLIVALLTVPTWALWNWLMPELFSLREITIIEALGVTLLSAMLFKGSGS